MPRARNIKPGFFMNEDLADICPEGRLLFIGLWMLADREGRLEDRPKKIKAEIFPYENYDVDSLLNDLESKNFIKRYSLGNAKDMPRYIQVITFTRHQNPHPRESKSIIPPYNENAETVEKTESHEKELPRQDLGITKDLPSHEKELSSNAESPFSESPFSDSLNPDSNAAANARAEVVSMFENCIHPVANEIERDSLIAMIEEDGYELVKDAIKEAAANRGRSVRYIQAILDRWRKEGKHGRGTGYRRKNQRSPEEEKRKWDNEPNGWRSDLAI